MNESKGARDLNAVSKVLTFAGIGAIVGGVLRLLTLPAELPLGADGWFESASARGHAQFLGIGLLMFGAFGLLSGLMLSARGRRAAMALRKQDAQAMGEGIAAGLGADPKARLERLEALRRDGTLTEEEYRRKRAEIVDQL